MIYIIFILLSVVVCPPGANINTITLIGGDFTIASNSVSYLSNGFNLNNLQTCNGNFKVSGTGFIGGSISIGNSGFNTTLNKSLIVTGTVIGVISYTGLVN